MKTNILVIFIVLVSVFGLKTYFSNKYREFGYEVLASVTIKSCERKSSGSATQVRVVLEELPGAKFGYRPKESSSDIKWCVSGNKIRASYVYTKEWLHGYTEGATIFEVIE